ncbi:hypothetical protein OAK26_02980 [Gammaproteobacteria bacterium]|jgi:hypothetical protein|nr:hypothetical protein [Gammaproteobacteria bacterium]|tara:strand:- start:116 stop:559 length:444 start_codon:yes stop_codon:yes gene_type:complete
MMDMSYKEKSLLASLGATLLVFGWYFYQVFSNQMFNIGHEFTFNDIFKPIILFVVLEIIIQSFLAGKNKEDERDALIELTSYRNSYWVLSVGVWFLLIQLLYVGSGGWYDIWKNSSTAFISHLLLLFVVLAEVTSFITQLYHYRKGI